jgi:hypothetical protein
MNEMDNIAELLNENKSMSSKNFQYEIKKGIDKIVRDDGAIIWIKDGEIHKDDGPAIENETALPSWYKSGFRHTIEKINKEHLGFLVVDDLDSKNKNNVWYKNGVIHRDNEPAIEYENGTKIWFSNGKISRDNGPAIEYQDGTKVWFSNGKEHREDGPAVEYSKDSKRLARWFINGNECEMNFLNKIQTKLAFKTKEEIMSQIIKIKLSNGKNKSSDQLNIQQK